MTPTNEPQLVALTTVVLENGTILKGDRVAASDPRTRGRTSFFADAGLPDDQLRKAEADLFGRAVADGYQHPPAPAPIRMRARRSFTAEIVTQREIQAGEEFLSDSDIFLDNHRYFERA